MAMGQILGAVVVVGAFATLLAANVTQAERNLAAQAEAGQTFPVPAFSQRVNAVVAAAQTPAPATPAASPRTEGIGLAKVAFTFPTNGHELPPGPNLELVQNNCTACHSPGMILTQPKLTKATWTAEVDKMRQTYKAPVADADVEPIVAYLTDMPIPK